MIEQSLEELVQKIDSLQEKISLQEWKTLSRTAFVEKLDEGIEELNGIRKVLDTLKKEIEATAESNAPDATPLLEEFKENLAVLEKNLLMEKSKKTRATLNVTEQIELPELYASLEQKILSLLLKTRHFYERAMLFNRKQDATPLTDKSTAKTLIELIRKRDEEIEELRQKYQKLKRKGFLGTIPEETTADLEQELNTLSRKLEVSSSELSNSFGNFKGKISEIENNFLLLNRKLRETEEIFEKFMAKSFELVTILKKEREFAKKTLLEVEHETIALRNSYTKEILNLQQAKINAKREAEEKYTSIIARMKRDLTEKEAMLKSLRGMVEKKEKKIDLLEEKLEHFKLLLKTKQKHEAIKKQLSKSRGKKKQKKKKKR